MDILSISAAGIIALLTALQLKSMKTEYGTYLIFAAGIFIFLCGGEKLKTLLDGIRQLKSYISLDNGYMTTLFKMTGITYVAEFTSGMCRDAGYSAMGTQIEIFGKLSILAVSMPIILTLMQTMKEYIS